MRFNQAFARQRPLVHLQILDPDIAFAAAEHLPVNRLRHRQFRLLDFQQLVQAGHRVAGQFTERKHAVLILKLQLGIMFQHRQRHAAFLHFRRH